MDKPCNLLGIALTSHSGVVQAKAEGRDTLEAIHQDVEPAAASWLGPQRPVIDDKAYQCPSTSGDSE